MKPTLPNMRHVCCMVALLAFSPTVNAAADPAPEPAPKPADASTLAAHMDPFMAEMEASPLAPPSYTLAIARGDGMLYSRVHGPRVLGGKDAVTLDTPFYIASVTKSFVGLLASRLDADGTIPLDATLKDMWPTLKLPAPIDPAAITMHDLLSHTFGFENDPLVVRAAYTGHTGTNDYQALLEAFSKPTERTFSYSNLGYLIYAAILERKTGKSWQDWMVDGIGKPLGLATLTAKPDEAPKDSFALGNHFDPAAKAGWLPATTKADDQMHAAGGLFISTRDATRWLQANLRHGVFPAAVYEAAQAPYAKRAKPKKYGDGLMCAGYGLGWQTCDYQGHRVLYHGGTYDGMMIFMAFMPDDDLVVSSINGARAFGWTFGWNGVLQGIDYALGLQGADDHAKRRLKGRLASQQRYANFRVRIREQAFRAATTPEAAAFRARLQGGYRSAAYGDATVCDRDGKLTFQVGDYSAELLAGPGQSAVMMERAYGEPSKLKPTVAEDGTVSFDWEGGTFTRVSGTACLGEGEKSR